MITALKRNVAFAVVTLAILGGGAVAFANGSPSRPTLASQAADERPPAESQKPAARSDEPAAPADEPAAKGRNRPRDEAQGNSGPRANGHKRHRPGPGPLRGAIHGDLIVPNGEGGFESVTMDRGTLTEVRNDQLKLERADGQQVVVRLTEETRYKGVDDASQLRTGRPVFVVSKDGVATHVAQRPREDSQKESGENS